MTTVTALTPPITPAEIFDRFHATRQRTIILCDPLSVEDMMVQSCPEASPAKWHLAHTAWFFESFLLREFSPGYHLFHPDFPWLFNSYYQTFSRFPEKRLRSSFSRPGLDDILHYRGYVDAAIERIFDRDLPEEALRRMELGIAHEEQHQELLLTDMLNAFFTNPLRPVYRPFQAGDRAKPANAPKTAAETYGAAPGVGANNLEFLSFEGGLRECGYAGRSFCFDNELPRHRRWLEPFSLARRMVTCGEYAAFMADGGYTRPNLWLSAGWDAVMANGWNAPLYWTRKNNELDGEWRIFTLRGEHSLADLASAPVSHVSYYEADAYARWAGKRLATEFEWEAAAEDRSVMGNLLDTDHLMPAEVIRDGSAPQSHGLAQLWGDCWEWTASAYLAYPGFQPLPGSLGEYNGKFMSGQMVLRGGSCVTPAAHIRYSYRNFFAPETRWQFSGIRLAS